MEIWDGGPFGLVVEVGGGGSAAEEEVERTIGVREVLDETTESGDSSAGTDHDQWGGGIFWEGE